jgi:hypothetical protein
LEDRVSFLQKTMGGIVKLVKDLKVSVEELQNKALTKEKESEKYEINEILEAQKVIDEILVANCDAIKRIDREIQTILKSKNMTNVQKETFKKVTVDEPKESERNKVKMRRY